eukprot:3177435-Alexandrium_andersonii.AAC.1
MSASLVGSEMCIRDSLESEASRKGVRYLAADGGRIPNLGEARLGFLAKDCLLYTSDAADDM